MEPTSIEKRYLNTFLISFDNRDIPRKQSFLQSSSPTMSTSNKDPDVNKAGLVGKSQHEFIKLSNQTQPGPSNRLVSQEELANHNSQKDAWLSLEGVVYDVTAYLKHHPGGVDKLMQGVGRECKDLFYEYHPWVNAKYLLEKYKVGRLGHS